MCENKDASERERGSRKCLSLIELDSKSPLKLVSVERQIFAEARDDVICSNRIGLQHVSNNVLTRVPAFATSLCLFAIYNPNQ